jgi:signal peptidase II
MLVLAAVITALDQITKWSVIKFLPTPYKSEIHILPGFFRLVHWQNPGAAWSMFSQFNWLLALISGVALVALFLARKYFGSRTTLGWIALGLIFGGIVGNVSDRIMHGHVIDFLYFHLITRSGNELGFPAFNVADSAICIGVGLLFILSWRKEQRSDSETEAEQNSPTVKPHAAPQRDIQH